ncbi:ribosomal RNA small subunit methyltransferase A [Streptomyces nigra]|uniref:ribosomal RNA small subunit methyltransferase A n=1 Tax=Streptomyces nigra TaxID=1827580 RepID=UPI00367F67AE
MARPSRVSRALSQNFLADRAAAGQLARLAAPHGLPVPLLLEVGAGKGALTELLAPRCRSLLAYEIDPRLVPVLRSRFADAPHLTDATLLTQLEYARKRTGDYGSWTRLTVLTWPRHEWRLAGRVGRRSFRPVPRVDAGIVRIERRRTPLLAPGADAGWRELVELGFSGAGGSLHASLRRARPRRRVDAAFRAAGLDRDVLVGEVPPWTWLRLHEVLGS